LSQSCPHPEDLAKRDCHSRPKTKQASGRTQKLPISLLCVPCKLLERLLLFRLEPVVDPQPPTQQGGFGGGRSTVQQIFKLVSDIVESYEGRRKTGLDLVDLTAACHTVWHQDLALKLLQIIPD